MIWDGPMPQHPGMGIKGAARAKKLQEERRRLPPPAKPGASDSALPVGSVSYERLLKQIELQLADLKHHRQQLIDEQMRTTRRRVELERQRELVARHLEEVKDGERRANAKVVDINYPRGTQTW